LSASIKLYTLQAPLLLSLQVPTARPQLERHRPHEHGGRRCHQLRVHLIHGQVVGSLKLILSQPVR
jgi:hypothetical protein